MREELVGVGGCGCGREDKEKRGEEPPSLSVPRLFEERLFR